MFGVRFFSLFFIYLFCFPFIHFFFSVFLSSLEGPMIIYCFFIKQGLHKKYFKSFNRVGKSIVIIRQFATTKELWLLSYLTRNIGYKVSFHNKLVVPFGYGNKRSLSVFPFKCVYSHFGFPWESVSSLWLIVAMVKKDGYLIFLPYLRIDKKTNSQDPPVLIFEKNDICSWKIWVVCI